MTVSKCPPYAAKWMAAFPSLFLPLILFAANNSTLCVRPYCAANMSGVVLLLSPSRASTPFSNRYLRQLSVYETAA